MKPALLAPHQIEFNQVPWIQFWKAVDEATGLLVYAGSTMEETVDSARFRGYWVKVEKGTL